MKCETPARSARSSREPTSIQKPSATERTLGNALRDDALAGVELAQMTFCTAGCVRRSRSARARLRARDEAQTVPFRFASYSASSARRKSVCASSASSGHAAQPKLAPRSAAHGSPPCGELPEQRLDARHDLARVLARSPPRAAPRTRRRRCGTRRPACAATRRGRPRSATSASSPAAWPKRSLSCLKPSRSATHEAERAPVATPPARPRLEPADERAPVEEARERIVVGEEAQLAEMPARDERGGSVVGEDPQRLQPVGRRHEPVGAGCPPR